MANVQMPGTPFWKDDEIVMDKDGIPHFTGHRPELMKEYRKRVIFAYRMLEGEGDTPEKEARDLSKKKKRFGPKLLNALHGEAWRCCQSLLEDQDKLTKEDGYKEVFRCLQSIEKVTIVKKTEQFDQFFEKGFRKRGQALDIYLRSRRQDWYDLQDLDDQTKMSDDLLAYFILKQCGLSREERRQILLNSGSEYNLDAIEKSMRVSFHDVHERERTRQMSDHRKGSGKFRRNYAHMIEEEDPIEEFDEPDYDPIDENADVVVDEAFVSGDFELDAADGNANEPSDYGASDDDEIYEAYAAMEKQRRTYQDSRRKLRETQKSRGFFKGNHNKPDQNGDDSRKAAIEREKARTRCSACGRLGHWAGDSACSKASRGGPYRGGKSKGKGRGKNKQRAYAAADEPLYFNLGLSDDDEASAFMIHHKEEDEQGQMEQDAGWTELDDKRKTPTYAASVGSDSSWSRVAPGYNDMTMPMPAPEVLFPELERPEDYMPQLPNARLQRQMPVLVRDAHINVTQVANLDVLKPDLSKFNVRQLQEECSKYDLKVSGKKDELQARLEAFYNGEPIQRKGCSKQFVQLEQGTLDEYGRLVHSKSENVVPLTSRKSGSGAGPSSSVAAKLEAKSSAKAPPQKQVQQNERAYMSQETSPTSPSPESEARFFRSLGTPPSEERMFRSGRAAPILEDLERMGRISGTRSPTTTTTSQQTSKIAHGGLTSSPLRVGEILPGVPCAVCNQPLCLRQNRTSGNLFFGCTMFGKTNCRFTMRQEEGYEQAQRAAAIAARRG